MICIILYYGSIFVKKLKLQVIVIFIDNIVEMNLLPNSELLLLLDNILVSDVYQYIVKKYIQYVINRIKPIITYANFGKSFNIYDDGYMVVYDNNVLLDLTRCNNLPKKNNLGSCSYNISYYSMDVINQEMVRKQILYSWIDNDFIYYIVYD